MTKKAYDSSYNILLIGETRVGKSCILRRFTDDVFSDSYEATQGMDIMRVRNFEVDGKNIRLRIVDKAKPDEFVTTTYTHYRGVHGIMIIFAVTNQDSFNNAIAEWLEEAFVITPKHTQKLLVGNKCDVENKRIVRYETAKEAADEKKIEYIETSAKTSENVEESFKTLVRNIMKNIQTNSSVDKKTLKSDELGNNSIAGKHSQETKRSSTCALL